MLDGRNTAPNVEAPAGLAAGSSPERLAASQGAAGTCAFEAGQCGATNGSTRFAADGSVCLCVCNLPHNHGGEHRFWGLRASKPSTGVIPRSVSSQDATATGAVETPTAYPATNDCYNCGGRGYCSEYECPDCHGRGKECSWCGSALTSIDPIEDAVCSSCHSHGYEREQAASKAAYRALLDAEVES